MADRNTRLGRRLSEHVAAVGGYCICVVVGGHPVEGLRRLRVQRHNPTLAASTSSFSPEPNGVRVSAVDGRSDAVGAKEDDSSAVEVAYLDGSLACC
jgi:hypothetical protein